MDKILGVAAAALLFTSTLAMAKSASQPTGVPLEASKPRALANAVHLGTVDESKKITFSVYLKFRNTAELDQLLEDQQTPGSARYQKFLTPEEFHQQFSPLPADVQKVKNELTGLGFQIVNVPAGGLFVTARGSVAQVKSAFHVTQELYNVGGKVIRSNAEAPQVPAGIAPLVLHIAGLEDTKKFVRKSVSMRASRLAVVPNADPVSANPTSKPCNPDFAKPIWGTIDIPPSPLPGKLLFDNCGYTPDQIRAAYGLDKVTSRGKGIRIGIVDLYVPTTLEQDLNEFSSLHDLPQVDYSNFQAIYPPGLPDVGDDDSCSPQGWSFENILDVEAAHSTAPDADLVYLGDACNVNYPIPMQAMYQAIDNRLADILSASWDVNEQAFPLAQFDADNLQFKQAAAEGISILISSGDTGDNQIGFPSRGTYASPISIANWPASSPWVTSVGGTSLLLNYNGPGTKMEYGWGGYGNASYGVVWTGPFKLAAEGWMGWAYYNNGGSGGGTSMYFDQPSYQSKVVPTSLSEYITTAESPLYVGTPRRVFPDIAMLADAYTGNIQGQTFLEDTPGTLDEGCVPVSWLANAEYCEFIDGGTSLATPLLAGVVATVDSARLQTGKPLLGFLNPTLYKLPVGNNGSEAPIWDVLPPNKPFGLIDNVFYPDGGASLAVVTVGSDINNTWDGFILGGDDTLMTTKGYDNVTGLGTPWVPGLFKALAPGAK